MSDLLARYGDFRVFAGDAFYSDVEDAIRLAVMRMVCDGTSEVSKASLQPLRPGRFQVTIYRVIPSILSHLSHPIYPIPSILSHLSYPISIIL